ncbi:MAG TPA: dienelactone hydrolase family protein [Candidatus Binatia bacterium]|nr:dienelactone hydrolase family protein [Candidatus Binatia bacterium]
MRPTATLTLFTALVVAIPACGDGVGSAPPPDPSQPGPYAVGATSELFVRASSTTGEPRELDTVIWYPAPAGASGDGDFQGGLRDAPLASGGPFPLLVFSHGSCGAPGQSKFLTTRLASYGFVVAAPPHPGNTIFDGATPDRCLNPVNLVDPFRNRPGDVEFTIDRMLALSAGDGRFAGAIDASQVGIFGHSFGGQTVVRVAAEDARVRAVLALAPGASAIVLPQADAIGVPAMIQGGQKDTVAPFAQNQQALYDRLRAPRFLVQILNTGHFAFADACLSPTGTTYPDCAAGTLSQEDAHALVVRFAVPFFETYLAGDRRWASLLAPDQLPDGVVYVADP